MKVFAEVLKNDSVLSRHFFFASLDHQGLKLALDELSTLLLPWLQERLRWDGTRCENTIAYDMLLY